MLFYTNHVSKISSRKCRRRSYIFRSNNPARKELYSEEDENISGTAFAKNNALVYGESAGEVYFLTSYIRFFIVNFVTSASALGCEVNLILRLCKTKAEV